MIVLPEKYLKAAAGVAADSMTLGRLAASPLIAKNLADKKPHERRWRDAALVAAVSLTDMADGVLGRYAGSRPHGKWLDEKVDKAYVMPSLVVLAQNGEISHAHWQIKAARDYGVTKLRQQASQQGLDTGSRKLGKRKAAAEMLTLTVASSPLSQVPNLVDTLAGMATGMNGASGLEHVVRFHEEAGASGQTSPQMVTMVAKMATGMHLIEGQDSQSNYNDLRSTHV